MREEYETKLQDALQQMREEGEEQLRQVREEVEYLYERKVRMSVVWLTEMCRRPINGTCVDPDQTQQNAASHQDLY